MSMVFPAQFQLPLDAKTLYAGVFVPKCRVMSSKKKPLWLHFWRADRKCLTPALSRVTVGTLDSSREQKTEDEQLEELYDDDDYVILMFKAGDDLRQDQLTLQLLSVMNDLWVAEGLDMQMHLYSCVSTGEELGMIEVVKNSNTLAEIIMKSTKTRTMLTRKASTAFRAYKDVNVFVEWLQAKILEDMPNADQAERDREYETRRQNFTRSCAAYCVATFVLGIGDRHNDNVMMTHDGHFFHIDFGHFLGRWVVATRNTLRLVS
jgi:phosphatidylinositol-4,5-bisphosphate 3-kinase